MSAVEVLRKLAEQQQYRELIAAGESCWELTRDPAVPALLALARAHLGERAMAEQWLERALAPGATPSACVDAAAALIVLQRIDEAISLLEQALAEEPEHGWGLARLGFCRMLQGEVEQAQRLFERANAALPGKLPILANLAHTCLVRSEYTLARPVMNKGLEALAGLRDEVPSALFRQYWCQLHGMLLQLWVGSDDHARAEQHLQDLAADVDTGQIEEDDLLHCVAVHGRLLAENGGHAQAEELLRAYLRRSPKNILLHLQLAQLAQVQGQLLQAVRLLERGCKLAPDDIALHVQLSSVCLHRLDQRARSAAEKAVELAEARSEDDDASTLLDQLLRAQAWTALALVDAHEQNFADAERRFRAVLAEHPSFVPALQGLGQQQMQRGELDEAIALFERIKQIDLAQGYGALISAHRFPEDEETLERLEQAAHVPSLEGSVRAGLLFRLAVAWEKREQYARAFELVQQANAASRKLLPYDPSAHRNRCARIRARFCKALYEHRPDCGVPSKLPVFVVGMPRSGTTLVEQIVSGHSRIFGAGELGVIPRVVQGLSRWERHVGSGRRYPDCIDDLTPEIVEGIANGVLDELRELAPEAARVVDKLPHNFEQVGLIKFLFPNAKIISVRRDPRAIAISNYFTDFQAKHGGMGFAYDLTDIGQQLADHNLLMHHWHQLFPGEILELQYEEVVDDLEGSARRMLDYIGVEWEPQVLDFAALDRTVKTASVWQVRQPLYSSSKAKWKRYQAHLAPLIRGTNARIEPAPEASRMLTLPEPGFLARASALFNAGDLDGAELAAKKMLHHNPDHAACRYLVGMIYLRKGHTQDGVDEIEQALAKAPHHREWRTNLATAHRLLGNHERAAELEEPDTWRKRAPSSADPDPLDEDAQLVVGPEGLSQHAP